MKFRDSSNCVWIAVCKATVSEFSNRSIAVSKESLGPAPCCYVVGIKRDQRVI